MNEFLSFGAVSNCIKIKNNIEMRINKRTVESTHQSAIKTRCLCQTSCVSFAHNNAEQPMTIRRFVFFGDCNIRKRFSSRLQSNRQANSNKPAVSKNSFSRYNGQLSFVFLGRIAGILVSCNAQLSIAR